MKLLKKQQKLEERDISDANKLLWAQYYGPMQQAAATLNAAITNTQNLLATVIAKSEGLDPSEWVFDMDRVVMVKRPKPKE